MKIDPKAKRHATEIINLIEKMLETNNDIYGDSFLDQQDYEKLREKLEKKFTRIINDKNKIKKKRTEKYDWINDDRKGFDLPAERDWFSSEDY